MQFWTICTSESEEYEYAEHLSLRTKLVISFNQGKIKAIALKLSLIFALSFNLVQKEVMVGWG